MRSKANGFTLVELTIAIAILGILAAVAGPTFRDFINSSRLANSAQLVETNLGKVFSKTRSTPTAFVIQGWEDSRFMEIAELGEESNQECTEGENNCMEMEGGVMFGDDFEITYLPPYGDIENNGDSTEIIIQGVKNSITLKVHHNSGLVEKIKPENL